MTTSKSSQNTLFHLLFIAIILIFTSCEHKEEISDKEQFINNLISQMTLEEKLGQMNLVTAGQITTGEYVSKDVHQNIKEGLVGGIFNVKSAEKIREIQDIAVNESRLKIPLLFGMDVIHGYETTFPIPLGLSCSWDTALIRKSARIAAIEATSDGINWTFSPMVDLSRDPRWGRVSEGSGEDPFLGSAIAQAMVKGYQQSELSSSTTLLSCVKHFALYGAPEGGRDYNTVDMSRIRMYNEYFPPYKAAIEAGAGSVMTAFNEVDGIPATGNKWLLTEVLRNQWGFKGFVISDYTSLDEMMEHGMGNLQQVSALALNAGLNMDMVSEGFLTTLKESLDDGIISMETIDESVRLILSAKYDLGLFEDPYKYLNSKNNKSIIFNKEHRNTARKIASQSIVLLKNEEKILPLKKVKNIALIGPLAHTRQNMAGTWSVATNLDSCISVLDGLQYFAGDSITLNYAKGSNLTNDSILELNATMFGRELKRNQSNTELLKEALFIANQSDIIIAALGESSEMSGESSSRTNIQLPDAQQHLFNELIKTGKPVILLLFTGRPLVLNNEDKKAKAILNVWFPGTEAGLAIADVLFGHVNPSGKLTTTFPRSVGQIPIYYNHKNTGRPLENNEGRFEKFKTNYLDERNEPLYPFGFGLSYTEFEYSNMQLSKRIVRQNDSLEVSIEVKNTGNYDGYEVVQLYVRDFVGTITRPVKELKGFKKIFIEKGNTKTLRFVLTTDDLKFYNYNLDFVVETGKFSVMIGPNSRDLTSMEFKLSE
ncbi:MAG: beta-glucosidase BglX [Bacteroidales bacterium]|nr:beta-glucosidase BglX [Bacteroidales bacterium]